MRNFDNWNRYLDNNNKPLRGCVMFNVKDGNTVAPIYDSDGTALDNPQLTDEYGRTQHQVFIDTDVVAYFYKYIGTGNYTSYRSQDIDINDDTLWSLQYTSENINDVLKHITSDSAMCIGTISELRNLDITNVPDVCGEKVITLLGYNAVGDKEPVNYIWNSELEENDDNGSIIQGPELTGRWVLVKPTEHCDSRHFGIFPQNTTNFTGDTARMNQWIAYCNSANLRPYFSANGDYKYYKYNNLTFTIPYVDIAKDVVFLDNGTSNIWTTEFNGDPYFYNHATNINSKYVKTSWGAYLFINPEHVVIDDDNNLYQLIYSNCVVDLNVSTNKILSFTNCTVNINKGLGGACGFSNCIIHSKNMISAGCHFANCKLTEDMFYGSPFIHVDGNCIADFNDFEHKELMWLRIKEQQQQINYDWEGKLTAQNPWENVVDTDRWLLNYKGTNVNAVLKESDNPHTYFIENCAGTITLEGKAANTYFFKNCEMNVKFADGFNTGASIRLQNTTINVDQDRVNLYALNCQDSVISGTGSFDTQYAYLYNTVQNVPVYCGYCDVKDCNIGNTIQVYGINQDDEITVDTDPAATGTHVIYHVHRIISGNFVNNFVAGQIEIGTVSAQDPHIALEDLVRGLTIKDNVGLSVEPIVVHPSLSSSYDNYNIYTYKGNTGTMSFVNDTSAPVIYPIDDAHPSGVSPMTGNQGAYIYTLPTHPNDYACRIRLFTIGTININVRVQVYMNTMARGLGAAGGLSVFLTNTVTSSSNYRSVKKTYGVPYTWDVLNMPLCAGLYDFHLGGDIAYFTIEQV